MFTITKDFEFSAAHQLSHLPEGHKCARPHGHNYVVRVELMSASLDRNGFVVDYGDLSPIKTFLNMWIDHRDLQLYAESPSNLLLVIQKENAFFFDPVVEHPFPSITSAEMLAAWFWSIFHWWFPQILSVSVSETPKTWAKFSWSITTHG